MKSQVKIAFFGTSDFVVPSLEVLVKSDYKILAVITQPDKPMGRKGIPTPPPVKTAAQKLSLKILQPEKLKNNQELVSCLLSLEPDIGIVASYGKIIPKELLGLPKYGFINTHPSLLPKYRGPSPIQTAILNGEKETGVTIMKMDEQVDHGPAIAAISYQLSAIGYYKEIEKELADLGAKLLVEILPRYINGEIKPQEQDHSKATFTKMLTREDGRIDWNRPAEEIYNQVRAFNPEPGTWTTWKNRILNIKSANWPSCDVGQYSQFIRQGLVYQALPDNIVKINGDIAVATKTCYLILKRIQLEGGKEMDAKSFLNGHPDFLGSKLE